MATRILQRGLLYIVCQIYLPSKHGYICSFDCAAPKNCTDHAIESTISGGHALGVDVNMFGGLLCCLARSAASRDGSASYGGSVPWESPDLDLHSGSCARGNWGLASAMAAPWGNPVSRTVHQISHIRTRNTYSIFGHTLSISPSCRAQSSPRLNWRQEPQTPVGTSLRRRRCWLRRVPLPSRLYTA